MQAKSFVLILLIFISAFAVLLGGSTRTENLRQQIDSLQAVHQQTREQLRDAKRLADSPTGGLSGVDRREIVWTTRAILSETKQPEQMVLIGNVIRNRMDLSYRGKTSVKQIILDPYQFSAFNPNRSSRSRYIRLSQEHVPDSVWQAAWTAARFVMQSPRKALPFRDKCVTHFVHPDALLQVPRWTRVMEQVRLGDVERPDISFFRNTNRPPCR